VSGHLVLFAQGESVVESVNWAVVRRGSFHLLVPVAVVAVEDDAPLLLLVRRRRLAELFGLLLVFLVIIFPFLLSLVTIRRGLYCLLGNYITTVLHREPFCLLSLLCL